MDRMDTLRQECEKVLIEGLPSSLKATLDRLHRRGYPHGAILTMVRTACVRAGAHQTCPTALACEAYLANLAPPEPGGCCGQA